MKAMGFSQPRVCLTRLAVWFDGRRVPVVTEVFHTEFALLDL